MLASAPTVVYHKNCPSRDGFCSALVAYDHYGQSANYIPMDPTDDPKVQPENEVFLLDVALAPLSMDTLLSRATNLVLLDHHESNAKKLSAYKAPCTEHRVFDFSCSACALTWQHFYPDQALPPLLKHIQARDLWNWADPSTAPITSWLDVQLKDFDTWHKFLHWNETQFENVIPLGESLLQQKILWVEDTLNASAPVSINNVDGLMINASGPWRSDLGSALAKRSGTFGLVWRISEPVESLHKLTIPSAFILCSLRASLNTDGTPVVDVAEIAEFFGGGGHPASAAFRLPLSYLPELAKGYITSPYNERLL